MTIQGTQGSRKEAVAKIFMEEIKSDKNEVYVNDILAEEYFKGTYLDRIVYQPFDILGIKGFRVRAYVSGGGISAAAQSIRHGIAKALRTILDPEKIKIIKKAGFFTRDSREVERKKYGRRKARKRQQWKKR